MNNPLRIFKIKKEERWLMLFVLVFLTGLHALLICKYYDLFTPIKRFYWPLFIHNFRVSGFDPITYSIVSDWSAGYNVYRHPLLAFFIYPVYLLNQVLISLTGQNCAIFVVAAMQLFWGFYAMLFFYRIVREVIGVSRSAATILTVFFLSFAYVMLSCMVPDHFVISMMLLLLALYISGRRLQSGRKFAIWQTVLYFFLTAGVSLNNGLKIFLASLFVNGKSFFRPSNILIGVLFPAAMIWGFSRWEYRVFVWPQETQRHTVNAQRKAKKQKKALEMLAAQAREDSLLRAKGDTLTLLARQAARKADEHKKAEEQKRRGPRQGAPIANSGFARWTDITSSRWDAIVENLLGESIQLHQSYLLGDVMRSRPMVVRYKCPLAYVVEGFIVLLFLAGIWMGRRNRFLWLVMSIFGMDVALHVGLGFGINEVYIMSAHWIYAIPVAIAYLLREPMSKRVRWLMMSIAVVALYLFIYNTALTAGYLL